MPHWALAVVGVAVMRVALALMLYAAGWAAPLSRPLAPLWVYAALSTVFVTCGLALVVSQRRDRRAESLGALLVLVGCPLVRPLIAGNREHALAWVEFLRPEVFTPAFAWMFAASFPQAMRGRAAAAVSGITFACGLAGFALFALSLGAAFGSSNARTLALPLFDVPPARVSPMWLLVFALGAPTLPVLIVRALTARGTHQRSARLFIAALSVGLAPITVVVLAEGLWPALADLIHQPAVEPWVTGALFAALGTIPLSTAHAVLFDRVVDVRIVLHAAVQYVMARYVLALLTLIPFGGLVLYLLRNREQSLSSLLFEGGRPVILVSSVLTGVLAMQLRPYLLRALDRRYHRAPYDPGRILTSLTHVTKTLKPKELAERARDELSRGFHAPVDVFLLDDENEVFRTPGADVPPITAFSPLVRTAEHATVDVWSPAGRRLVATLPEHERRWLEERRVCLLAVIRSPASGPVGLIAAGEKASGLPYSSDDRALIAAAAAAVGLSLDSLQLQRAPATPLQQPARECEGCGTVYPPEASTCCGRQLLDARVPYVLRGAFRFERRVGTGGSGVVYRAMDLGLGRTVAVKVLSHAGADLDELLREARSMVGLSHAHLAAIYGVERWGEMPLLVQEFLDGGTLADRLRASRLSNAEIRDVGLVLSDVLENLHRQGIVHCDVKPSNIGFTQQGVVKLFDFSVARHIRETERPTDSSSPVRPPSPDATSSAQIVGTPAYMSPEAIRGETLHPGFDWWGLSVVLFEAIAGRRPFDGKSTADVLAAVLSERPSLRDCRTDLPPDVVQFFEGAFDPRPHNRPAQAAAFRRMLNALADAPG